MAGNWGEWRGGFGKGEIDKRLEIGILIFCNSKSNKRVLSRYTLYYSIVGTIFLWKGEYGKTC